MSKSQRSQKTYLQDLELKLKNEKEARLRLKKEVEELKKLSASLGSQGLITLNKR